MLRNQEHRVELLKPSSRMKVKVLSSMKPRYIKFGSVEIDLVSELTPEELQIWTPKPHVLYKSPATNAESLDAFMMTSNHELILLQLTVAKKHPVKVQGLKALLNRFKGKYNSCCIVFVCPSSRRLHKIQNLVVKKESQNPNIPQIIKKYKLDTIQYVLPLKFPSSVNINV